MKALKISGAAFVALGLSLTTPALAAPAKVAPPSGDAAKGAALFSGRCVMCHAKEGAGGPMAPALRGVYGAKAGSGTSPRYSAALKASGLTWTEANLTAFLAGPGKLVPGSNMMISVAKPEDRTAIVAYLATLKK